MQNSYVNKAVLVVGGTSGIGKATALAFADAGAKVVITGRREKEGADVAAEIKKTGGAAAFVRVRQAPAALYLPREMAWHQGARRVRVPCCCEAGCDLEIQFAPRGRTTRVREKNWSKIDRNYDGYCTGRAGQNLTKASRRSAEIIRLQEVSYLR